MNVAAGGGGGGGGGRREGAGILYVINKDMLRLFLFPASLNDGDKRCISVRTVGGSTKHEKCFVSASIRSRIRLNKVMFCLKWVTLFVHNA